MRDHDERIVRVAADRGLRLGTGDELIRANDRRRHAPLLQLPYFWDEAGYYVPAARDLLFRSKIFNYLAAATPGLRELVTIGKVSSVSEW